MRTYLFTYAERVLNIRGSSKSSSVLYTVSHHEIVYQLSINCLLENYASFKENLQVSPYPIPNHADHRLNRLLKCHRYSKSEVYR